MLVEQNIINEYARSVTKHWQSWSKGYSYQSSRIDDLHKEILRIGEKCNLPKTSVGSGSIGFDSNQWRINTGPSSYNMDTNLALNTFLEEAKMVYLLNCDAEQYWLKVLARVGASATGGQRPDFLGLNRTLKVPYSVLDKAWEIVKKPVKGQANPIVNYASVERLLHNVLATELSGTKSSVSIASGIPLVAKPVASTTLAMKPVKTPKLIPKKLNKAVMGVFNPLADEVAKPFETKSALSYQAISSFVPLQPLHTVNVSSVAVKLRGEPKPNLYVRWPKVMMTDDRVVKEYVRQMHEFWRVIQYKRHTKLEVICEMGRILERIHKMCDVPVVDFTPFYDRATLCGTFNASKWTIKVNVNMINGDVMSQEAFFSLVETLYHEGRHTEQAWILLIQWLFEKRIWIDGNARYEIYTNDLAFIERATSIPGDIVDGALNVALNRPDVPLGVSGKTHKGYQLFTEMVNKWRESQYGIYRLITNNTYENMNRGAYGHHKYRSLPMESDAFYIEEYVRQEFEKIPEFIKVVEGSRPLPCSHCGGKDGHHK